MKKSLIVAGIICMMFIISCVGTPGPAEEGPVIDLQASEAELKTTGALTYESGPDRDNVGWWESPDDEISWTFDVAEGGEYSVTVKIACASSFAGATVGVTIADQLLTFKVPDTGEWSMYFKKEIGNVNLEPGTHTCLVKGIELANRFFGNLQSVTLKKVG